MNIYTLTICNYENGQRIQPEIDKHGEWVLRSDAEKEIKRLRREIKYLKSYGNKDCLAMAEEAMDRGELDS